MKINRFLIFARNTSLEHCYVFGSILLIFDVNTSIFNQFLHFAEFLLGFRPALFILVKCCQFLSSVCGAWFNFGIFWMSSFRLCPFLLVLTEFFLPFGRYMFSLLLILYECLVIFVDFFHIS